MSLISTSSLNLSASSLLLLPSLLLYINLITSLLISSFLFCFLDLNHFKKMQAKPRTPRTPVNSSEVRRSSRAKNPPPSYREVLFSWRYLISYHSSMNEPHHPRYELYTVSLSLSLFWIKLKSISIL